MITEPQRVSRRHMFIKLSPGGLLIQIACNAFYRSVSHFDFSVDWRLFRSAVHHYRVLLYRNWLLCREFSILPRWSSESSNLSERHLHPHRDPRRTKPLWLRFGWRFWWSKGFFCVHYLIMCHGNYKIHAQLEQHNEQCVQHREFQPSFPFLEREI